MKLKYSNCGNTKKTQIVMKLKKLLTKFKTQIVMKLKNSYCEEEKNSTQNVTKLKNSNFDKTKKN